MEQFDSSEEASSFEQLLIIAFLVQTLQISTKFTAQFLSNSRLKMELKTEVSNMEKSQRFFQKGDN